MCVFSEMSEMSSGSEIITDELITKPWVSFYFKPMLQAMLERNPLRQYCSQLTFNTALIDFPVTREDAIYAVIYGALFAIGAVANAIVIVVLGM